MSPAKSANETAFEGVRLYQAAGYEYLTTYFSAKLKGGASEFAVAEQFTALLSSYAHYGYEFLRTDDIPYEVHPGCFAGLLGAKSQYGKATMVTFRKRL